MAKGRVIDNDPPRQRIMLERIPDGEAPEIGPEDEETPDELRAMLELDGGGEANFQIWRTFPANRAGFCGDMSAGELTISRVQQDYGAGKYRIRGIRSNGTYLGQRTIMIAEGPKFATAPAGPNGNQTGLSEWLAMQETQSAKRSEEYKAWAAILAPLALPFIAKLFDGNRGPTLAELAATLQSMKSLSAPESTTSKLGELKEILGIVKDMQPESTPTGSTWVDLIRDGIKEVGPALGAIASSRIPGMQKPDAAPNPQIAAETQAIKETNPMLQLLAWLKEQLAGLTHQASLNKDPSLYAEVVIDNIPAGVDPAQLLKYLSQENWWPMLTQFYPGAQAYPAWFAECHTELIKGLQELLKPVQPPAPKSAKNSVVAEMPKAQDFEGDQG